MLETQQEEYLFDCGIQYFNANQYKSAHKEWEELWKLIGHLPRRSSLKVFLQLTGIYQNIELGKWDAVRYGIRVANQRLTENLDSIKELIEVDAIEAFLLSYRDKKVTLKAFHELVIQRNGVEFTKTSELSKRLPLPHTKGTKPAP